MPMTSWRTCSPYFCRITLTEGPLDPKEVLEFQGVRAAQQYLVDQVQEVYRSQGVDIHDKHIEMIVRQMLRRVRVVNPGDSSYLPAELVEGLGIQIVPIPLIRDGQTYLDGVPLNIPWDERVDLETIPLTGSGRVEGTRGLTTLLDGPGALAGSARLLPPETDGTAASRVAISVGTGNSGHTNITHQNRVGPWRVLLATGWLVKLAPSVANSASEVHKLASIGLTLGLILRVWLLIAGPVTARWKALLPVAADIHKMGMMLRF
mgnify:CR=1 FL=1